MAIFGRVLGEKVRQTVGFTGKIDPTSNDDYMKSLKSYVSVTRRPDARSAAARAHPLSACLYAPDALTLAPS